MMIVGNRYQSFFFCMLTTWLFFNSCSSGLKQLLKLCTQCGKNYDHIIFSNSDVMVESENNNEFPALCQEYDEGRKITCIISSTCRFNASPLWELLNFIFWGYVNAEVLQRRNEDAAAGFCKALCQSTVLHLYQTLWIRATIFCGLDAEVHHRGLKGPILQTVSALYSPLGQPCVINDRRQKQGSHEVV